MILDLRVTHKGVSVPELEAASFGNRLKAVGDISSLDAVKESVILQTCHRVEVFIVARAEEAKGQVLDYWVKETEIAKDRLFRAVEVVRDSEALRHLLSLAAGLESMIVGEDQILGQVKDTYLEAKDVGTLGPILGTVFLKAISVGGRVRRETAINKGSVSIGSAGVDLAERILGDLRKKRVLVIGAGELGTLVGKALAKRRLSSIFVANRTYERGVRLAKMINGEAVRFKKLDELLPTVDTVLVASGAPHYVLTAERVKRDLRGRERGKLLIIDLSQPRNVEESVALLPNVRLHTIDDLRAVAEKNLQRRMREIGKVKRIINVELKHLEKLIKRSAVEPVIIDLCNHIETVRRQEIKKAIKLGSFDKKQRTVVDDLTKVLVKKILYHPLQRLRSSAEEGDGELAFVVEELFKLKKGRD